MADCRFDCRSPIVDSSFINSKSPIIDVRFT